MLGVSYLSVASCTALSPAYQRSSSTPAVLREPVPCAPSAPPVRERSRNEGGKRTKKERRKRQQTRPSHAELSLEPVEGGDPTYYADEAGRDYTYPTANEGGAQEQEEWGADAQGYDAAYDQEQQDLQPADAPDPVAAAPAVAIRVNYRRAYADLPVAQVYYDQPPPPSPPRYPPQLQQLPPYQQYQQPPGGQHYAQYPPPSPPHQYWR